MLIIKCNLMMKEEGLKKLHKELCRQAEAGVVVLPTFCELLNEVPKAEGIVVVCEYAEKRTP